MTASNFAGAESRVCKHVFFLYIPTMIIMLHQQLAPPAGTNRYEDVS